MDFNLNDRVIYRKDSAVGTVIDIEGGEETPPVYIILWDDNGNTTEHLGTDADISLF